MVDRKRMCRGRAGPLLAGVVAAAAMWACGAAARQVLVLPDGGAVALSANTAEARARAAELMGSHCPAGFDITREEEVLVGERVREETTTEIDRRDRVTSTTEYKVRRQHEWRIYYTCR